MTKNKESEMIEFIVKVKLENPCLFYSFAIGDGKYRHHPTRCKHEK